MAPANLRVAAGIGIVAAFLLAGAPSAAVAIADPGGSHSGRSDNRDGSGSRNGSDWSDDNVTSRVGQAPSTDYAPRTRVGSGRDVGTSDERSGPDYSPDPSGAFERPKVTVGDGRTPGVQDREPQPRWNWSPPEPPPPPPPEVVIVPLNPPTVSPVVERPGVVQQLVVAPTSGLGDPLWGVAGLLLIPAAGAVLGYRQARGAHAAAELGRHP